MQLLSVNIGKERTQKNKNKTETTGIYKTPVPGRVQITTLGIKEDFIGSPKDHGGPDQAIYVYGKPDYQWWSKELARELEPGTFGDNLTISDVESAKFCIGDRFHIGSVILEVTAPRIPCATLAARMGDPFFVKKYRRAERPGLYCRIIGEGTVEAGDAVRLETLTGEAIKVIDVFRDYYQREKDEATLRAFLKAPIAIRARKDIESDLEKLLASSNAKPG